MKCRWNHCRLGGEVDKDNAKVVGKQYFHPECFEERENINEVIKLYTEKVDASPIMAQLRKAINDIIYKDGVDSAFLLFAFRYCLDNGWKFHSPFGLRYISKDVKVKIAWDKKRSEENNKITQIRIEGEDNFDDVPVIPSNFSSSKHGFASILR